jgi:hypothetical protein
LKTIQLYHSNKQLKEEEEEECPKIRIIHHQKNTLATIPMTHSTMNSPRATRTIIKMRRQ